MNVRNIWLLVAGCLSFGAALLHLACIVGGPDWYRFFGAGEEIARAAERGSWVPAIMTAAIATVLAIWGAYAFAGAGVIRRLPLMRTALILITLIYVARGLMIFFPPALGRSDLSGSFVFWSSLVVLIFGIVYAVGTWMAWDVLSLKRTRHALDS